MTFRRTLIPALSVFVALSLPGVAGAQVEREAKDQRRVTTSSSRTIRCTRSPMARWEIRSGLRPGRYRVQLIRPRAHFIPEMFKSVEHI